MSIDDSRFLNANPFEIFIDKLFNHISITSNNVILPWYITYIIYRDI